MVDCIDLVIAKKVATLREYMFIGKGALMILDENNRCLAYKINKRWVTIEKDF